MHVSISTGVTPVLLCLAQSGGTPETGFYVLFRVHGREHRLPSHQHDLPKEKLCGKCS